MTDTIIIAVVAFVFGIIIAGLLIVNAVVNSIRKGAQDQMQEIAQEVVSNFIFLRIEEHPEGVFAYDAMAGDFVCQGKDMEDLNVNFGKRYPNKKGVLVEPDKGETHELLQRN
jgi:hypothetical protein